jgi:Bacteriophage T4-like portal protein (Gp20)
MQIFGFEIKKKEPLEVGSVVSPTPDDGAALITSSAAAHYGMVVDLEGVIKNENDLIRRYREIAQYPDCDSAIEDIVNECIVQDSEESAVEIKLDDLKLSDGIKNKIKEEFENVTKLFEFEKKSHDVFRAWYVDGRLYYHILVDEKNIKNGIAELRYIDPRKIRKIKTVNKKKNGQGVEVVTKVDEYYLYNDKGITEQTTQGVKLSLDSVIYCPSGLLDANTNMMLSNLHKAIKPVNQLKMIEDALVIYRMSRAPERRIFYIDVGNLPKLKAEQYVNDMMNKFRNKVVYDANTGEVKDNRRHLSMMEDFWMPRREGGKGTEITTLPGGQNLGAIEDIQYFQNKLYQSLNVPISRLTPNTGFSLGRSTEISRDEIKFNKFVERLRNRFATLFLEALRVQCIFKGIIRPDEWEILVQDIKVNFREDNHFAELKDNEILQQRVNALQLIEPYIGKFYSIDYVRRNVLMQSDDDIKEIDKQIQDEEKLMIAHAEKQGAIQQAKQGEQE